MVLLFLQGRAWLYHSLVQKTLSSFMHSLLSKQEVLRYLNKVWHNVLHFEVCIHRVSAWQPFLLPIDKNSILLHSAPPFPSICAPPFSLLPLLSYILFISPTPSPLFCFFFPPMLTFFSHPFTPSSAFSCIPPPVLALLHLQIHLSQITVPPWCIPVLRWADCASESTHMLGFHWL